MLFRSLEIEAITGGAGGSHHLAMVDWADRAHSKLVLGQVLSAEAKATGMGSGVADLQGEVRDDIKASDARQLAATLTRDLVYPLVVLNRGGIDGLRRCPRLVFDLGEAEDLKLYSEALPKLAENGARIPVPWVHEKLRIPEAQGDEPVFGRPQPSPPVPPAAPPIPPATLRAALAALAAARPPASDGIDTLVDALPLLAQASHSAPGTRPQHYATIARTVNLLLACWIPGLVMAAWLGPWLLAWWVGADVAAASTPMTTARAAAGR